MNHPLLYEPDDRENYIWIKIQNPKLLNSWPREEKVLKTVIDVRTRSIESTSRKVYYAIGKTIITNLAATTCHLDRNKI